MINTIIDTVLKSIFTVVIGTTIFFLGYLTGHKAYIATQLLVTETESTVLKNTSEAIKNNSEAVLNLKMVGPMPTPSTTPEIEKFKL